MTLLLKGIQFYVAIISCLLLCCVYSENIFALFIFLLLVVVNIIAARLIWEMSSIKDRYIYTGSYWFNKHFNLFKDDSK